jgi:putative hydrolase of the HAD superfamily
MTTTQAGRAPLKAIFFDLGGVLVKNKMETVYAEFARRLCVDPEQFREFMKCHQAELQTGIMSSAELAVLIRERFSLEENVLRVWEDSYRYVMPVNTALLDLLGPLKERYCLVLVSNTNDLHARINRERGIYTSFHLVMNSYKIGLAKPHKEMYIRALEKVGLEAGECVVIDDRLEHLSIPKEMGFRVIQYINNAQLFSEFEELGIAFKGNK